MFQPQKVLWSIACFVPQRFLAQESFGIIGSITSPWNLSSRAPAFANFLQLGHKKGGKGTRAEAAEVPWDVEAVMLKAVLDSKGVCFSGSGTNVMLCILHFQHAKFWKSLSLSCFFKCAFRLKLSI